MSKIDAQSKIDFVKKYIDGRIDIVQKEKIMIY